MKTKLLSLAKKIGFELEVKRKNQNWTVIDKGQDGVATSVDLWAEEQIVQYLSHHYPDIACWGEERVKTITQEDIDLDKMYWLIDPLDGTNNYINGLPFYCISIALCKGSEIEVGFVYNPVDGHYFFSQKNKGTLYFDGDREVQVHIKNRTIKKIEDCLFSPGRLRAKRAPIGREVELLDYLRENCRAIRRFGAAAWEICLTAQGGLDGFWQYGLKPWDIAAGILIAREAGLIVNDFDNNAATPFSKSLSILPEPFTQL